MYFSRSVGWPCDSKVQPAACAFFSVKKSIKEENGLRWTLGNE